MALCGLASGLAKVACKSGESGSRHLIPPKLTVMGMVGDRVSFYTHYQIQSTLATLLEGKKKNLFHLMALLMAERNVVRTGRLTPAPGDASATSASSMYFGVWNLRLVLTSVLHQGTLNLDPIRLVVAWKLGTTWDWCLW